MPKHKPEGVTKISVGSPKKTTYAEKGPVYLRDRREAKSRNKSARLVSIWFFGFVIIYIAQSVFGFAFGKQARIEQVTLGVVSTVAKFDGLIIRDETIYTAPTDGELVFFVREFERVKKGAAICAVQDIAQVDRIVSELNDVNAELLKLQETRGSLADSDGRVRQLNAHMKDTLSAGLMTLTQDLSAIGKLKEDIEQSVALRNDVLQSDSARLLSASAQKREQLSAELSRYQSITTAQGTGIVCLQFDGFETQLTTDLMEVVPKELFKLNPMLTVSPLIVKPGDPIFKLTSNVWYIAAYIPNAHVEGWEEGQNITIRADREIPVTIQKIIPDNDEKYVLLKSTRYLENYANERSLTFSLSESYDQGLKISRSAVMDKEALRIPRELVTLSGAAGDVAILEKTDGSVVEAQVLQTDEFAVFVAVIPKVLEAGMQLVTPGSDTEASDFGGTPISQAVTVKGLYKANTGIAEFKSIIVDDTKQNTDYYILDPELNRAIKEKDSIVTNHSLVTDGELLF